MVFQMPVVSGVHRMVHWPSVLKTVPGAGPVGLGSANASNAVDKIKVGIARRENIRKCSLCVGRKKRDEARVKGKVNWSNSSYVQE
jgi:hypothetical protein